MWCCESDYHLFCNQRHQRKKSLPKTRRWVCYICCKVLIVFAYFAKQTNISQVQVALTKLYENQLLTLCCSFHPGFSRQQCKGSLQSAPQHPSELQSDMEVQTLGSHPINLLHWSEVISEGLGSVETSCLQWPFSEEKPTSAQPEARAPGNLHLWGQNTWRNLHHLDWRHSSSR